MKKLQDFFHNQSLRTQLTIWFLLIALIPLAWITFMTYEIALNSLQKQAEKHLNALGSRQVNLLNLFFSEKERSALALAKETVPSTAEETLARILEKQGRNSVGYQEAIKKFRLSFTKKIDTLGYRNFIITDDEGTIILSLTPEVIPPGDNVNELNNKIFQQLFFKVKAELKPQISPLFFFGENSTPGIFIATPLTDNKTNQLIGVLFFQLNNSAIYQWIQNFHGLGNTVETLIATEIESQLIVFSSFLEKENYPRIYRVDPNSPFGKFITDGLANKHSNSNVEDYRGKEAIVIWNKTKPNANWIVITKVDQEEIISSFIALKYLSWLALAITTLIVTLIASYVARKISDPILMLTEKTKLMTTGDLTQRINIPYNNELGRLGISFNEMAIQLDHLIHHLDSLVANRTKEIENKNIQLKQKIEELRETQNRLITQEKLASLGALTAGIAHEIKNPLNFVNNFAELSTQIQQDLLTQIENMRSLIPAESMAELEQLLITLKANLEKIYKHGKRADSIVHNMLQHSRANPGDKDLIDLNSLLDEYVDLAYHGLRAKDSSFNTKIEKNYDSQLPKAFVSPQEISRVFLNLLNNAFYAVNERKKKSDAAYSPFVKISTLHTNNQLIIKIWDNGNGISKQIFPKLFTPFFTTKPTGEGTGLGLSLSYNIIVQGHNGMLTAKSEEGSYAEFTISLPHKEKLR